MGIYLNPGTQLFEESVNSQVYIDKTEMIHYLNTLVNTEQKCVCVSRPRRFGKTMATKMLCAYYSAGANSRPMFEKLKLSNCAPSQVKDRVLTWDCYLGKFDVIRLVMTDFLPTGVELGQGLTKMQKLVGRDLRKAYSDADFFDVDDLGQSMADAFEYSGRQFIIIIDEWDAVFRANSKDQDAQTKYLDFLRNLLKDKSYIALAYMTGILPIKKYGQHSALNMFDEYSVMTPMRLAPYTGFTEDEVSDLCDEFGRDYHRIREWYDGYIVSDAIPEDKNYELQVSTGEPPTANKYSIYSPLSVVNAIRNGIIQNYWNKTETYEALAEFIRRDYDGLKDAVALLMDGGRLKIDTSTYQNDMTTFHSRDDILSLLIHLGYLGYDIETSEVFIPNREILDEFKTSTKSPEWVSTFRSFELSQKLLKATWDGDAERVAELVEDSHNKAGNKTYHDEAALSYAIQLAYYAAQKYYTTILELDTGKGYADIVYLPSPVYPDKPALLIELKYEKGADTALSQIKRQKYPERLEHYKGNILLVGISYDKETPNDSHYFKHHTCVIERA